MKKPKEELRDRGECLLGIAHYENGTRYRLVTSKRTLLDFVIYKTGERVNVAP